jgi:4-hydroxybenzoate polyprenyltransferase
VIAALGHLALWAALYAAACVAWVVVLSGEGRALTAGPMVFAACTAGAVYLLDRVKWRDGLLDPADAAAHPERQRFLRARRRGLRAAAAALLGTAVVVGAARDWALGLLPFAGWAGVWIYAGRRPREAHLPPRPKDLTGVKNAFVACGLAGFAGLSAEGWTTASGAQIALAAGAVGLVVLGDAVLCDLDDLDADAAHGTWTLPVVLGRMRAGLAAWLVHVCAAAVVLAVWRQPAAWALAVGVAGTTPLFVIRAMRAGGVRDWVDLRLPVLALLAVLIG